MNMKKRHKKIEILTSSGVLPSEAIAIHKIEEAMPSTWKGYASFYVNDGIDLGMEIDLLLITADRIILCEFKNWSGHIESDSKDWFQYRKDGSLFKKHISPVSLKRRHAMRLKTLFDNELKKVWGEWYHINNVVIMTGNATYDLRSPEKRSVHSLEEFIKIIRNPKLYEDKLEKLSRTPEYYNNPIHLRPNHELQLKRLDQWIKGSKKIKDKFISINSYQANTDQPIFEQNFEYPLYSEFKSQHRKHDSKKALLRVWDFRNDHSGYTISDIQRANIAIREYRAYTYIESQFDFINQNYLMRCLHDFDEEMCSEDLVEIYEFKPYYVRLDNYLAEKKLSFNEKLELLDKLLIPFESLHSIQLAHRDLSLGRLWYDENSKSVLVSGFITAKFPEIEGNKSVSDIYRNFISTQILPFELKDDNKDIDPYRIDVFQLGVIVYEILFNKKLYSKKDDQFIEWVEPVDSEFDDDIKNWLKCAIDIEASARYKNIYEMRSKLNEIIKNINLNCEDDNIIGKLENYKDLETIPLVKWPISNHATLKHVHTFMQYKSNIDGDENFIINFSDLKPQSNDVRVSKKLLNLMRKCNALQNSNIDIPKILKFGWGNFGAYIVHQSLDLQRLNELNNSILTIDDVRNLCLSLLDNIIKLHDLNFSHGDLKPENLLYKSEDNLSSLVIIDLFDYGEGFKEKYNGGYDPDINSTSFERDIFACYKISYEIINNRPEFKYVENHIYESIFKEEEQLPLSLEHLRELFVTSSYEEDKLKLNYWFPSIENGFNFAPDQDRYYIFFYKEYCTKKKLKFTINICGKNKELVISSEYSNKEMRILNCQFKDISVENVVGKSSQAISNRSLNSEILKVDITFLKDDENSLENYIQNLESFNNFLSENAVNNLVDSEEEYDQYEKEEKNIDSDSLKNLWKYLLDSERDLKPSITIEESSYDRSKGITFKLVSSLDISDYEDSSMIDVYGSDTDFKYGQLDIANSDLTSGQIIVTTRIGAGLFEKKKPTELKFISRQESSSQDRRKRALDRILQNTTLINNLDQYFVINNNLDNYNKKNPLPLPNGKILDMYEKRLKPKQLDALKTILTNQFSVVMGPPGTGKTTLLGHLLDYLNRLEPKPRILIVSQSNVAVDELASKARSVIYELSLHLNEDPSLNLPTIVRLGDKEKVADDLLDIHVEALQSQYRKKFHREFNNRILAFAERLHLSKDYVLEILKVYHFVGREIFEFLEASKQCDSLSEIMAESESPNFLLIEKLDLAKKHMNRLKPILLNKFSAYDDNPEQLLSSSEPLFKIFRKIAVEFGINNPDQISNFIKVVQLTHDWLNRLSNDSDGFASFMANSRNWIVGTLVGIGKKSYEIVDKKYDLVIVDEAARASASELAMAMQSAHRIVLVGDHLQLPPMYDKKMIKAVSRKLNLPEKEVRKTDFERALISTNGVMLEDQFRMAPEICEIISKVIYKKLHQKELKTARPAADDILFNYHKPWNRVVSWIDTSDQKINEITESNKISNDFEVNLICKMLIQLINSNSEVLDLLNLWLTKDKNLPPIGIITGYSGQVAKINSKFDTDPEMAKIKKFVRVDTIDAYQGSENRIIILSLVRHNSELKSGFMSEFPRINVAISRAKERLIIIGSADMWKNKSDEEPLAEIYRFIEDEHKLNTNIRGYQVIPSQSIVGSAR